MFSQNSVSALRTEFDKLSKIMGASHVTTQFGGDGAYTNGKIINLPEMDMSKEMTPKDQAIARGYHIHEVGHITDTDFSIASAKKPSKKLHPIWNACEDVMIERKAIEKFSGAKRSLSAVVDSVLSGENKYWSDNPEENTARREKWWTEVPYAALQQARHDAGYESEALDEYIRDMPKALAEEARQFANDMAAAADTAESYDLAKKISRRVAALAKKHGSDDSDDSDDKQAPPQLVPSAEGNGPSDDDGEGTQADGQQGDGDQDDGDQAAGQGDDDGDEDGDDQAKSQSTSGGFTMEGAEQRKQDNMDDVFKAYASDGDTDRVGTDFCKVFDNHQQVWEHNVNAYANQDKHGRDMVAGWAQQAMALSARDIASHNEMYRSSISNDVRAYGARLARLLMSQESKRNEGGYSSGRIDRRRLSQLVAGNQNIFARAQDVKTSETRIMLAVDGSSSMMAYQTIPAIHVVNDALGRAGVKFDVSEWAGLRLRGYYEKTGHLPSIVTHKTAHENYKKLHTTLNFQPAAGDTPSYSALLTYAQMMSAWKEPRKILLMVTDGEPNGWTREKRMCRDLVKQMEASGIEVIGIGIGIDVSEMFDKNIETDFKQLGSTLLGSLEKLLISEGHAHAA